MQEEKKEIKPESLGKVVLLLGGMSSEREVSLMSGKGVYDALVEAGVDVTRFDPKEQSISECSAYTVFITGCQWKQIIYSRQKDKSDQNKYASHNDPRYSLYN